MEFYIGELIRLQEAMHSAPWIIEYDENFNAFDSAVSDSFLRLLGYTRADYDGVSALDFWILLIQEEDRNRCIEEVRTVANDVFGNRILDVKLRAKTKSRGYRWFQSVGLVTRREDGSPKYITGLLVDINEKMETEKRINRMISSQADQLALLTSMAKMYLTMHLIDIPKNRVVEINSTKIVKKWVNKIDDCREQFETCLRHMVTPEFTDRVLDFCNLDTLQERITGKKVISMEFIGRYNGWVRISFIAIDENENTGIPNHVLFTSRAINDEKVREERLVEKANRNGLTKFFNRRAYEHDKDEIQEILNKENFAFISIDVNGLKNTNDSQGHDAGDELIQGTAECLDKCFSKFGKIYRTGGDEFIAVLEIDKETFDHTIEGLVEVVSSWKGTKVEKLTISAGYVTGAEGCCRDAKEVSQLADHRMYKAKAHYYETKGIDRRGQHAAYLALCKSYLKILKTNLTEDTFTVIQIDSAEKTAELGYNDSLSAWLKGFGESDMIHEEDKTEYFTKTNLEYLRKYFDSSEKSLKLFYRRKINGKLCRVMFELIPADDFSPEKQSIYLYIKKLE